MKTTITQEKKGEYTFYYVNFRGAKVGIRPYKGAYQLLELLANEGKEYEVKYEEDKVYLIKEESKIRIFGVDWTASRIIRYMGGNE